jgi:hypothetical protein
MTRRYPDRIYHGCGHFWISILVKWDDGDELVEGWHYDWDIARRIVSLPE